MLFDQQHSSGTCVTFACSFRTKFTFQTSECIVLLYVYIYVNGTPYCLFSTPSFAHGNTNTYQDERLRIYNNCIKHAFKFTDRFKIKNQNIITM